MKIKLVVPNDTYSILCQLGPVDEVVNKIAKLVGMEEIPYDDLPLVGGRNGQKQFFVDITDEDFLALYELQVLVHRPIRMRRVVQYFVDNELYNDPIWADMPIVKVSKTDSRAAKLSDIVIQLASMRTWHPYEKNISQAIESLREVVNAERQRLDDNEGKDSL